MNPESCPKLYTCSKIRQTPLIKALLRCSAAEAMKFICANCVAEQEARENDIKVSAEKAPQ